MNEEDERNVWSSRCYFKRLWIDERLIMSRFKYALNGLKTLLIKDQNFHFIYMRVS